MIDSSEVQFDQDLLCGVQKANGSLYTDSFDSGYSASPVRHALGVSPTPHSSISTSSLRKPGPSSTMDDNGFFITSPNKYSLNSNMFNISPLKTEPVTFSPFKESSLSPFKLINQSPSKGSFDDWDKDFIASFEENLFGIGDISENTVEELMKSPKGKALLERGRNFQSLHANQSGTIRISPLRKPLNNRSLFAEENGQREETNPTSRDLFVKQEQPETFVIKRENVENDHMYGQTFVYVNTNGTLSAIDPDKMSATPIKPRATHVENAPKRKLAMKMPSTMNPVQTIIFQSDQTSQLVQNNQQLVQNPQVVQPPTWPSKERLNFARSHFQKVLNSAVEKERQILQEIQSKTNQSKNPKSNAPEKTIKPAKATGGKSKRSTSGKGKGKVKKTTKKDKYPEISMALSKPVHPGKRQRMSHSRQFADSPLGFENLDVYIDNMADDDDEDDDLDGWTGRPPFYSQLSTGFDQYEELDTSDEEWTTGGHRYQQATGGKRAYKKRRR